MLKRGITGRRLGFAIGLAAAGVVGLIGVAVAAPATIVGTGDNTFTPTTYTQDQGDLSVLQVTGSNHNATATQNGSDGKALFRSATITGGTTPVNGTQFLTTGSYQFICTIHPTTMVATLNVSANGTPQARPQATLSVKGKSLSRAIKKGIAVAITANTRVDDATLTAKLGKTTLGKTTLALAAGAQTKLVKLSKAGKNKLRSRDTAKVTVTAELPFGSPASAKKKLS